VVATTLAAQGIEIGRSQSPLDTWIRISIGLPEDNRVARRAVENLLR
jgi:histidinol-phosphate aminotransferase